MAERTPGPDDRRVNKSLRELLDDLLEHVRELSNNAADMPPAEMEYAQQRLEWLADEIWHAAVRAESG